MTAKPLVICMVGLPRSGKSTWSMAQGCPVVNKDSIRLALHGQRFLSEAEPMVDVLAHLMLKALVTAGHRQVIVDECNVTRKRRDAWRNPAWDLCFMESKTVAGVCKARCVPGVNEDLHPVIDRMASQYESLGSDERRYKDCWLDG